MAFRYRQKYFDANDALNIEDWNLNIKELAEEYNGYLDRDNFPNGSFTQAYLVPSCCNKIYSDDSGTTWNPSKTTSSWQHDDGSGNVLPQESIDVLVDGLLICEFGCGFNWTSAASSAADNECIRFKVTVDGVTVSESGWLSSYHMYGSVHLAGALPVVAGSHLIEVWIQWAVVVTAETTVAPTNGRTLNINQRELVVIERRR